jgi:hypothetical protein
LTLKIIINLLDFVKTRLLLKLFLEGVQKYLKFTITLKVFNPNFMNKNVLLLFVGLSITSLSNAQDRSTENKKAGSENIYTSLKPADGTPAFFSSQEDLNAKVPGKKSALLNLIKENAGDTAQVRMLREQLWRFENAIIKPANK